MVHGLRLEVKYGAIKVLKRVDAVHETQASLKGPFDFGVVGEVGIESAPERIIVLRFDGIEVVLKYNSQIYL